MLRWHCSSGFTITAPRSWGPIRTHCWKEPKKDALSNFNSHLLSEKKITLGTYPGVEFEAESDAAHFSARIYMVGTTLYQTLAVAALGKPYADATRFLDSFQLIARVPN